MAKNILGVGFPVFSINDSGELEVFTVKELRDKPEYFKKKGMISFPLETFEEKDVTPHGTILRLIKEEMGFLNGQVKICHIFREKFNLIPGRRDVFTAYGYGIFTGDRNQILQPEDDDVAYFGWKTIPELFRHSVRIETSPILDHFLDSPYYRKLIKKLAKAA
ncbi:MAG: hypothetical protein WCV59_02825 [Parcubacteria group bacterium]|jgi:hypothetical protein